MTNDKFRIHLLSGNGMRRVAALVHASSLPLHAAHRHPFNAQPGAFYYSQPH
jgi:hypothetical protein